MCAHMWQQYIYYMIETYTLTTVSIIIGWLIKEGKVRRKRYFVLTDNNQLRYYRTEDTRQPVSGNIHLNRSVTPFSSYYLITASPYNLENGICFDVASANEVLRS